MVLPGWGQVYADRPVLGWALIVTSLGATAFVAAAAVRLGAVEVVALVLEPDVMVALLTANVALAVGRLVVSTHAWRTGGGRGWAAAAVLSILVLAPHVLVGWAGWLTRDTLTSVFAAPPSDPVGVPASSTTTLPPTTTTVPSSTTTTEPAPATSTSSTTSTTTTTTSPTTTTTAPTTTTTNPAFGDDRLNVLVLGGDAGPGRSGLRTDTMLVGSVDPETGDAALFGLPRNYGSITFSNGEEFPGRILNEVYAYGHDHPNRFGGSDPGAAAATDVAEHLTGIDIDHFMLVDLIAFGALVDALGGVTLDVPQPIYGPLYDPETGGYDMIEIPAGRQTLNGGEALAYSRARLNSSDYARMARQRCLLTAMVDGLDAVSLLSRLPEFLDVVETHLSTDLPLDTVPDLVRIAGRIPAGEVRVVGFGPDWSLGRNSDGYHVPDIERIRSTVRQAIESPDPPTEAGVSTAADACG